MSQNSPAKATPHGDQLRSAISTDQQTTDNLNSSKPDEQQIEHHQVEGTAFVIVGVKHKTLDHKEWAIFLGKYKCTQNKPSKELCEEMIKTRDYELLIGLSAAQYAFMKEMEAQGRNTQGEIKEPVKGLKQATDKIINIIKNQTPTPTRQEKNIARKLTQPLTKKEKHARKKR